MSATRIRIWSANIGAHLWLDPGERDVQDYSTRVIMDIVKRYDIDGIHLDDYFYPYPEKDAAGNAIDFPDEASWKRYGAGGSLSRDDWRRENVNAFIERVYRSIKAAKPWVQFGISPFGIWRPKNPPEVRGFDAYAVLYADSRKWLAEGWLDYMTPQLYWPIEAKQQSFTQLLDWWVEQNDKGRHIWPGIADYRAPEWPPHEIQNQIEATRKQSGASGYVLYNMTNLVKNAQLFGDLENHVNVKPALIPASPWLGSGAKPSKPSLKLTSTGSPAAAKATWKKMGQQPIRFWLLQTKAGDVWKSKLLPAETTFCTFASPTPESIAIRAMDRIGELSAPAVVSRRRSE